MAGNYSAETKAKAVRLVREHKGDYPSEWAAISSVASRLGIGSAETLRKWLRQAEVDEGKAPGTSTAEAAEVRALRRKNRELEQTIAIAGGGDPFFRPGGRPATAVICAFIASVAGVFGVVPVCRALTGHGIAISPRTFHARRSRPPSRRAVRDVWLTGLLRQVFEPGQDGRRAPESLYGAVKARGHLRRHGITVARCTVERLMRANGWRGNVRGPRKVRTTVPDPAHPRHPDLVNRHFAVPAPGRLLVTDFTYVPLSTGGFAYVAFCIDAFAGTIRGWECSVSKSTAFVQRAIAHAAEALRRAAGGKLAAGAIAHSDAGSQYTSVRYAETLMLAGLAGSVGTVGDAYDNALAETTIGLYKCECVRDGSPFRDGPLATLGDVEKITSSWVHWYNTARLMHRTGLRPPAEADAQYWASQA